MASQGIIGAEYRSILQQSSLLYKRGLAGDTLPLIADALGVSTSRLNDALNLFPGLWSSLRLARATRRKQMAAERTQRYRARRAQERRDLLLARMDSLDASADAAVATMRARDPGRPSVFDTLANRTKRGKFHRP